MPVIRVEMFPGRTDAMKSALAQKITTAFQDVCGSSPGDVTVIFTSVPATDWYAGGASLQATREFAPAQNGGTPDE